MFYGVCAVVVALAAAHFPRDFDHASTANPWLTRADYASFYDALYIGGAAESAGPSGSAASSVPAFVNRYQLQRSRVLEVGAGRGELQDVVADYTGLDISGSARPYFHKPFVEASATEMPFSTGRFDAIWTVNTLEHVPKPEQALAEMRRVLKDGGLLYLEAAWQCRPWAANGYHVRPYADLDVRGKLVKASVPLRESVAFRVLYTFPIRITRWATSVVTGAAMTFRYRRLDPNYVHYWDADSDAANSMDAYEAILWFTSRGDELLSFEGAVHPLFVRSGALVIRVRK